MTITPAERTELLESLAAAEAELIEAQTAYTAWRASMDETQRFDWEKSRKLGKAAKRIEKRIIDTDQMLLTADVELTPVVAESTLAAA